MTETTSKTLSKYQKAMLTHMGIIPWQLKSESCSEYIDDTQQRPEQTGICDAPSQPPTQEQKQAGLDRLKQNITAKPKSLNGGVLLCMSEKTAGNQLIQDLLLFLDIASTDVIVEENSKPKEYCDYLLAWQIGEQIGLNDRLLTTLSPENMNSSQAKRKLWQAIQHIR